MTGVEIRAARATDSNTICRLVFSLMEALYQGDYPLDMLQPATERVLRNSTDVFPFLAPHDARPVGVIVLNRCTTIYALGDLGEISELYVEPAHRSAGVGAALIEKAVAFGRSKGWSMLEVTAPGVPKWRRSVDFYRRSGFKEIGPQLYLMLVDV